MKLKSKGEAIAPIAKCSRESWCTALADAIDDRAVRVHNVFSISDGLQTKIFVALHTGTFAKKGIVLNFCPFCRVKLGVMKTTKGN